MKFLDLSLPTPALNLACDEALFETCEREGGGEVLRVWESADTFVVLGYSNDERTEVNVEACRAMDIPVLRRCSGGGAVVQGRGCLNYALVLEIERRAAIQTLADTNRFVMARLAQAVQSLVPDRVEVCGATDLAIGGRKISGNAQRRGRRCVLFHGAFLLDLDLSLVERLLPMPSRQPRYRGNRPHAQFLMNLGIAPERMKAALKKSWGAR